jgi:serine phosphatase RsbU (regulator of sigma subunit)
MDISTDFLRTIYENLRLKSKILAIFFLAIVFIQAILLTYIFCTDLKEELRVPYLAIIGPAFILTGALAEIYALRFISRKIATGETISPLFYYVITAVEVSFPSLLFAFVFLIKGDMTAVSTNTILTSPPFVTYFIMISLSSLLMNVRFSVFAGVLACVEYLAIVLVLIRTRALVGLDIPNTISRAILLAVFGVIIGFISKKILESVRSSIDSKNKLINELDFMVKEKTKEVNEQNEELAEKNKDITDSINYAKNIQDAILPDISEIKKQWKDLFVFYQPKDIVSGDFYWFHKINAHEFLIACCDCTGHGVPGAFMSMLCSSKLHEAVSTSTEPDKILFYANNRIKENLGQKLNERNKDGMEICLMKVDTAKHEIHYAGANRPLWIFEHATKTLKEIKPTKASVASSTPFDSTYDLHQIKLAKGDIIYATSDGYCDQFGGKSDKKYMAKNFKTFLSKKADLSMVEQHEEIKTNINNWMGKREQVDDLLVIGIKL